LHPFDDDLHYSNELIKVSYEGETFNGKAHGIGIITYKHPTKKKSDLLSFKGLGTFRHGQLDGGPAYFKLDNNRVLSFSFFKDGAADGSSFYYDL
jgi:hypothetical protein